MFASAASAGLNASTAEPLCELAFPSAPFSTFLILTLPPHSGGYNRTKDVKRSPTCGCHAIGCLLLWEIFQSYCKPNFFASLPLLSVKLLLLPKTSLSADNQAKQTKATGAHFLLQS